MFIYFFNEFNRVNIRVREKEGAAILDLEGDIDINSSDLVETVGWVLNEKTKDIICNFGGVNLVDYVGLSLITVIYKNVLNHKGRIKLYNVPSHVMKIFSIVGLDGVFEYYVTEEQALKGIKEDKRISQILKKQLRRRFKRVLSNKIIEYKQKFSNKDLFYTGKIINLSAEGVFITSKQLFPAGELLFTRINLLPKPGILEVDTKVVWVVDKEMQPKDFPGMGLEFCNITTEKQNKIIQFIERHFTYSA